MREFMFQFSCQIFSNIGCKTYAEACNLHFAFAKMQPCKRIVFLNSDKAHDLVASNSGPQLFQITCQCNDTNMQ